MTPDAGTVESLPDEASTSRLCDRVRSSRAEKFRDRPMILAAWAERPFRESIAENLLKVRCWSAC